MFKKISILNLGRLNCYDKIADSSSISNNADRFRWKEHRGAGGND